MTSVVGTDVRPYLLAGEPIAAGDRLTVTFPYDGRVVAEVTLADEDAIERALEIATAARGATAAIPPHERASVLNRAAALAEERLEELAREIMLEAGALPGAVSVVPCPSALGERMAGDDRVKMLSFTGSAEVGWYLQKVAATQRVTLELGGNGAVIIHSDADLDHAAERCALGGFVRAGQACISVQRVFVAADVAAAFEEKFVSRVSALKLGDPLDDDTAIGVLVDEGTTEKALALIADAKASGATVVCGGERRGPFVEPTLLRGASERARVSQVEAFAPIVSLQTYTDFDEALAAAD